MIQEVQYETSLKGGDAVKAVLDAQVTVLDEMVVKDIIAGGAKYLDMVLQGKNVPELAEIALDGAKYNGRDVRIIGLGKDLSAVRYVGTSKAELVLTKDVKVMDVPVGTYIANDIGQTNMNAEEKRIYDELTKNSKAFVGTWQKSGKSFTSELIRIGVDGNTVTAYLSNRQQYKFVNGSKVSETTARGANVIAEGMNGVLGIARNSYSMADIDYTLQSKIETKLRELYPEIELDYTRQDIEYRDMDGSVMNQEEYGNKVNLTLKLVDTLYDLGTAKPSKHGGQSQPVRKTVRADNEQIKTNMNKMLASRGVPKEQIELMFEYMEQNDIGSIGTLELAEKLLFGLSTAVETETTVKEVVTSAASIHDDGLTLEQQFLMGVVDDLEIMGVQNEEEQRELNNAKNRIKEIDKLTGVKTELKPTDYYKNLTVPGGTNYKEMEIKTPGVKAAKKGHANFATDEGIGWYRVDDAKQSDTLRVLEMQSDMFQKMKDSKLPNALHQLLNTNKWVKFFIQSIVQNAERNGYDNIRFPAGETAADVEGHKSVVRKIKDIEEELQGFTNKWRERNSVRGMSRNVAKRRGYITENEANSLDDDTIVVAYTGPYVQYVENNPKFFSKDNKEDAIKYANDESKRIYDTQIASLTKKKQALISGDLEKLAPIEGFYQNRVKNTLLKTYGKQNVKEVTDEHGNKWFELKLDRQRDSQNIMFQKQQGSIKGQADLDAMTVLIDERIMTQDTLPHEYAHHYINWFRDTEIVQEAIKKWGSEEKLVQAIGEQVVKQKGEAYGWWKKFGNWIKDIFNKLGTKTKEELRNLLTDAFLTRQDLNQSTRDILSSEPGGNKAAVGSKVLGSEKINSYTAVQELANKLDEMDSIGTTPEHKAHLNKVLRKLLRGTEAPIREMNVYLNKKSESNGGWVDFDAERIQIDIGSRGNMLGTDMSLVETFVHEIVHAATHYGMNAGNGIAADTIRELKRLRSEVMKVLTVEDLMGDVVLNYDAEYTIAKNRLEYINSAKDANGKDTSLEEFLAYALTHEKVFTKLKDIRIRDTKSKKEMGILERLVEMIGDIFAQALAAFTGKPNKRYMKGDALIMQLVGELARVNKDVKVAEKNGLFGLNNTIDELEANVTDWIQNQKGERLKAIKERLGKKTNKKYTLWDKIQAVILVLGDEEGTPMMQNFLAALGLKQWGFIQTVIRHLKHADKLGNTMQRLTLASGQVDSERERTAEELIKLTSSMFKRQLKTEDKKALYGTLIEVDGIALVDTYGEDAKKVYSDDAYRAKEIEKLEDAIRTKTKNEGERRYMIHQTKGLASMMVTGTGSIVQRRNAEAIVMHVTKRGAVTDMVTDVDLLASLYAVDMTHQSVKDRTVAIMDREWSGVKYIAETQRRFKDAITLNHTMDERLNLMKNYHRESYDDSISTRIAKVSEKQQMEQEGYTLAEELPAVGLGFESEPLALYTAKYRTKQIMNRSSVRFTGDKQTGRLLHEDVLQGGDVENMGKVLKAKYAKAKQLATAYEAAVREGKEPTDFTTVVPELDEKGNVIDYRIPVTTKNKVLYMGIEPNPFEALGRSWAHEVDVEQSEELNRLVWAELMKDMAMYAPSSGTISNVSGKDYEYIEISKNSTEAIVRDYAAILPSNIKKMMKEVDRVRNQIDEMESDGNLVKNRLRKGEKPKFAMVDGKYTFSDEYMMKLIGKDVWNSLLPSRKRTTRNIFMRGQFKVRNDMLLDTFGIRDMSAAEMLHKTDWKTIKSVIRKIEFAWKEIVKIFKVDMIIRMLPVLMGNILSNLMYSIQYGLDPVRIAKMQLQGVKELGAYLDDKRKLVDLRVALAKDPSNEQLQREYARTMSDLKNNSAMPLLDAGLFQHIIEDVGLRDFKSSSRIARWIDAKTEGTPELIQKFGHGVFISEKTSLFQMVTKATAYSDFVARYAQFTLAKEKEMKTFERKNGRPMARVEMAELEDRLTIQVRDAYVNYSQPDSRLLQYLNDMGFVAFTKYFIRIQKSIGDLIEGKPLRFILAALGQELLEGTSGINPEDIAEKSIFGGKLWYSPGISTIIGNIIEPQGITYLKEALRG